MSIVDLTEEWVGEQFEGVGADVVRDTKVIRDTLHDTNKFFQHEVNVIDLPMLQRLRRVSQNGLAQLVYPCATHNRFQHTLGVTVIATKFADAIRNKEKDMIDESTYYELRLAALLHDIGHGPFSHVSESVYRSLPEVESEMTTNLKFSKCTPKPHEMLSYMIITSKAFKDFYADNLESKDYWPSVDLQNIANLIVGDMDSPDDAYKADIINGAFDSDKLDYIPRDCYNTGMKMDVDIDRIMYTISVDTKGASGRQGLAIDISGAPFVEQILFNKMLLHSSMYHHQKVRASECMLRAIFEATMDTDMEINGLGFDQVTDYLTVCDADILTKKGKPEGIKPFVENIQNRSMLMRALVISKSTVEKPEGKSGQEDEMNPNYQKVLEMSEDPRSMKILRELITQKIERKCTIYDIWVDLPKPPSFREPSQTIINITNEESDTLDNIFPIDLWLTTYAENKWRGFVFCPRHLREDVNKAAIEVFEEAYGVRFNKYATVFAKIVQ